MSVTVANPKSLMCTPSLSAGVDGPAEAVDKSGDILTPPLSGSHTTTSGPIRTRIHSPERSSSNTKGLIKNRVEFRDLQENWKMKIPPKHNEGHLLTLKWGKRKFKHLETLTPPSAHPVQGAPSAPMLYGEEQRQAAQVARGHHNCYLPAVEEDITFQTALQSHKQKEQLPQHRYTRHPYHQLLGYPQLQQHHLSSPLPMPLPMPMPPSTAAPQQEYHSVQPSSSVSYPDPPFSSPQLHSGKGTPSPNHPEHGSAASESGDQLKSARSSRAATSIDSHSVVSTGETPSSTITHTVSSIAVAAEDGMMSSNGTSTSSHANHSITAAATTTTAAAAATTTTTATATCVAPPISYAAKSLHSHRATVAAYVASSYSKVPCGPPSGSTKHSSSSIGATDSSQSGLNEIFTINSDINEYPSQSTLPSPIITSYFNPFDDPGNIKCVDEARVRLFNFINVLRSLPVVEPFSFPIVSTLESVSESTEKKPSMPFPVASTTLSVANPILSKSLSVASTFPELCPTPIDIRVDSGNGPITPMSSVESLHRPPRKQTLPKLDEGNCLQRRSDTNGQGGSGSSECFRRNRQSSLQEMHNMSESQQGLCMTGSAEVAAITRSSAFQRKRSFSVNDEESAAAALQALRGSDTQDLRITTIHSGESTAKLVERKLKVQSTHTLSYENEKQTLSQSLDQLSTLPSLVQANNVLSANSPSTSSLPNERGVSPHHSNADTIHSISCTAGAPFLPPAPAPLLPASSASEPIPKKDSEDSNVYQKSISRHSQNQGKDNTGEETVAKKPRQFAPVVVKSREAGHSQSLSSVNVTDTSEAHRPSTTMAASIVPPFGPNYAYFTHPQYPSPSSLPVHLQPASSYIPLVRADGHAYPFIGGGTAVSTSGPSVHGNVDSGVAISVGALRAPPALWNPYHPLMYRPPSTLASSSASALFAMQGRDSLPTTVHSSYSQSLPPHQSHIPPSSTSEPTCIPAIGTPLYIVNNSSAMGVVCGVCGVIFPKSEICAEHMRTHLVQ